MVNSTLLSQTYRQLQHWAQWISQKQISPNLAHTHRSPQHRQKFFSRSCSLKISSQGIPLHLSWGPVVLWYSCPNQYGQNWLQGPRHSTKCPYRDIPPLRLFWDFLAVHAKPPIARACTRFLYPPFIRFLIWLKGTISQISQSCRLPLHGSRLHRQYNTPNKTFNQR